jgi:hypothetical protein
MRTVQYLNSAMPPAMLHAAAETCLHALLKGSQSFMYACGMPHAMQHTHNHNAGPTVTSC